MGLRFGTGQDGDVIIATDMTIGASDNFKQYANLTINNGVKLSINSQDAPARILCSQILDLKTTSSEIEILGRPQILSTLNVLVNGANYGNQGGDHGNLLAVQAKHILGSGKIKGQLMNAISPTQANLQGAGGGGAGAILVIISYTLGNVTFEANGGNGGNNKNTGSSSSTSVRIIDNGAHFIGFPNAIPAGSRINLANGLIVRDLTEPGQILIAADIISKLRLLINLGNAEPPEAWSGAGGPGQMGARTAGAGGSFLSRGGRPHPDNNGGGGGGAGGLILIISKFDPINVSVEGGIGGGSGSDKADNGNPGSYYFMDIGNA